MLAGTLNYHTGPNLSHVGSDGVKAKTKAKAVVHKAKAHKAKDKDKVIDRDQGLRQDHNEPTQYYFLWRKYLPVTNSVY